MALLIPLAATALALLQQLPEDGRGQALFGPEWHAGRRAALQEQISKGAVVLRGAGEQNDFRVYRQDNCFWYFTGLTTPEAVLVLEPGGDEHLFVPRVDSGTERWLGDLIDPEEARAVTGIEDCRPLDELQEFLSGLARRYKWFYVQEAPAENWMMSRDNLQSAAASVRRDPYDGRLSRELQFANRLKEKHGVGVKDITRLLDALRQVKTPEEIEAMRRACRISGAGHVAVMRSARAGDYEWQCAATMTGTFLAEGAMGAAYAAIVGSGPNSCVLHYNTNHRQLQEGDVVMIDYGAEFSHHVADISRTWPVGRSFTPRQREVYQAVFDAQEAAFEQCRPGRTLLDVHAAAQRVLTERGFKRMWHGTSHWLGLATHDVGSPAVRLEPGMVFTVEPGVYLPGEQIGVRIEDVVAITEDGHELLSAGIPRRIEDIEALRGEALSSAGK